MVQDVGVTASRFASNRNGNCVQMECNLRSNRLERKKWSTSEGRSFVLGNFHLMHAFHLRFNRLNRKFWLNRKRPMLPSTSYSYMGGVMVIIPFDPPPGGRIGHSPVSSPVYESHTVLCHRFCSLSGITNVLTFQQPILVFAFSLSKFISSWAPCWGLAQWLCIYCCPCGRAFSNLILIIFNTDVGFCSKFRFYGVRLPNPNLEDQGITLCLDSTL